MERKLCKCGCGGYANLGRDYIKQHHKRGKPFNLTKEQIELRSQKLRGKNHYRFEIQR